MRQPLDALPVGPVLHAGEQLLPCRGERDPRGQARALHAEAVEIEELGLDHQIILNKGAVMVLPAGLNKATGT